MSADFAKLFGTGAGQIVVILQEADEGPEIRAFTRPPNLGVCSIAVGYEGADMWERAEAEFEKMDEERARWFVKPLIKAGERQA